MSLRDLRWLRVEVDDLDAAAALAGGDLGLMAADRDDRRATFRCDHRNYALMLVAPGAGGIAIGFEAEGESGLELPGSTPLTAAECDWRQCKAGVRLTSPAEIAVEVVWRPLTSGWPCHPARASGVEGLAAVRLACRDVETEAGFWTGTLGLRVSDRAGDAVFLALGEAHHCLALYPSARDGVLGVDFAVETRDHVMRNWYHWQARQMPVVAGPGRQPTSGGSFVTTRGPGGVLFGVMHGMDRGPAIAARPPRQFEAGPKSHCLWGSPTLIPEFTGDQP